jgi:putative sterol carrier protein
MDLAEATEKVRQKMARAGHIRARVKFDFGDDGVVFADTKADPPVLSNEDNDADATLSCSLDTFAAFLNGTLDPTIAFMTGRLKVKGSMGLAMKLNSILED